MHCRPKTDGLEDGPMGRCNATPIVPNRTACGPASRNLSRAGPIDARNHPAQGAAFFRGSMCFSVLPLCSAETPRRPPPLVPNNRAPALLSIDLNCVSFEAICDLTQCDLSRLSARQRRRCAAAAAIAPRKPILIETTAQQRQTDTRPRRAGCRIASFARGRPERRPLAAPIPSISSRVPAAAASARRGCAPRRPRD